MPDTFPYLDFALPPGWQVATVGQVAEDISSGFPSGQHNQEGRGVPHLRPMNVSPKGNIALETVKYVEEDDYDALRQGDVLFNNTNSPVWVGKTAYVRQDSSWAYSNHMTRIRPRGNTIDSGWLAYCLHHIFETGFFRLHCRNHVNQASINTTFLGDVKIPVPPPPEQKRIVNEIEKQFTRLDAAVAGLERIQANLERYKASVLKAACEGRLVPQEADVNPDYEPADKLLERILEERRRRWEEEAWQKQVERAKKKVEQARRKAAGLPYYFRDMEPEDWMDVPEEEYREYLPKSDKWKEKYEEPEPPDTDDLPELPAGWAWTTFDQLIVEFSSGSSAVPQDEKTEFPILRSSAVRPFQVDYDDVRYVSKANSDRKDRFLSFGDLLFTRLSGSRDYVGACAIVTGDRAERIQYPDRLFRATLVQKKLGEYLEAIFSSPPTRRRILARLKSTAGHQRISMGDITEQPIPVPPLPEALKIGEEVARSVSVIDSVKHVVNDNITRADRLRQSILQQAFSGNLVPQDPDDEPASALLARIRGKQEAAVKQPSLPFQGD